MPTDLNLHAAHWEDELKREVEENLNKDEGEKVKLTELFKDFAQRNNVRPHLVSYHFYKVIRPTLGQEIADEDDDSLENEIAITEDDDSMEEHVYKVGDEIEVTAKDFRDFGVICQADDGTQGLIHISEISNEYVTMPENYFYFGEKVRVKILRIEPEGKLNISTRALGGKKKISCGSTTVATKSTNATATYVQVASTQTPAKQPTIILDDRERDNIVNFIKQYAGNNITQQALVDIREMVESNGYFGTTLALMEAIRDIDISAYITSKAKEKMMGGEFLRRLGSKVVGQ